VSHRAFCVATAIALLTASSTAAWARVEDVGTPGPAILDGVTGRSEIDNKADALRFDPSVGSTLLSVRGRSVPIVGAGLKPWQEGDDDPERRSTATDYLLNSSALDAIPEAVNDSRAVDNDFILNGADDSLMTNPVGGLWTITHDSSSLDLLGGSVSANKLHASCSGSSSVMSCVVLEDALGLPTDGGTGAQDAHPSGQRSFGSADAASDGVGAPLWPQMTVGAALSMPPFYFSSANVAVALPDLNTVSTPALDFINPNVSSNSDPIVGLDIGDISVPTPSVPELPAPALFVIGLGGIALARRFRLRPSARFG
jgi:hypothetical protein